MAISNSVSPTPARRLSLAAVTTALVATLCWSAMPSQAARAALAPPSWRSSATLTPRVTWSGVAHVGGLFLALGHGSEVGVSSDGVTWSEHPVPAGSWQSVAFGDGRFIALSAGGGEHEMISANGITWAPLPGPVGAWSSITYGAGRFVAVGSDGQITTTVDGVHWSTTWVHSKFHFTSIAYGNGRFIAVDDAQGDDVISLNGLTWSFYRIASAGQRWGAVAFGDGNFVAFDDARRDIVASSVLGYTWTTHVDASGQFIKGATYGCGRFVAAGHSPVAPGSFLSSPTGAAWTSTPVAVDPHATWTSVAYGALRFVALDSTGAVASLHVVADCNRLTPTAPTDVSGNIPTAGQVWTYQHPSASAGSAPVDGYLVTITDGSQTKTCHAAVYYQPNCIVSGLRDRVIYEVTTQAHNRFGYSVPTDPEWVIPVASWRFIATTPAPVESASTPVLVEVTGVLANSQGIYPENWMTIHVGARSFYCQPSWFGECYVKVAHPPLGRTAIYATYTGYGPSYRSPTTYVTIVP